ncbi:flagellin [Desulfuromonas acetexigens]|uniref:Flagellin n=1 Tax=Trichloromonas acetexigens TaxID=38815 RepID=A0A550JGN9_9BACT|nr:flagellin [Desulfuromonas acetexigens]TRO82378.1 flagellin FliC [Desulfuromonas acetexigens]
MAMVINTNMASLNAQRHLSGSQSKLAKSMERLATGKRINSGQDDAAGLGISSRLGGKIRALNQSVRNANDGVSMAKAGDGALAEVANMLERMRELVNQKGDGALNANDKSAITAEMTSLQTEINNIKTNTKFNGVSLLSGLNVSFTVGETDTYNLNVATASVAAGSTASTVEAAIDSVSKARGDFGKAITVLESRAKNSAALAENLSAARSQILDADIAAETAEMTKANVLQQAGVSILAQANQSPQVVLSLLQ